MPKISIKAWLQHKGIFFKKSTKKKEKTVITLMRNDEKILENLNELQNKMESMDKINKKFLMAATMHDERTEILENKLIEMKKGIISFLDQIEVLLFAVNESGTETIKKELDAFDRKVAESTEELGIDEIIVSVGERFNSKLQECKGTVDVEEYDDEAIVELLQKGYVDKNGKTLRCASVIVNKKIERI